MRKSDRKKPIGPEAPSRSPTAPGRFRRVIPGVLLILLWLIPRPAAAARYTDALGRQVTVAAVPRRIVSLVPSVTETLFDLGLGERVVGVTRFATYPPAALHKPKVGGYADPSLEAVVALRPDLVFAAADATSAAFVKRLAGLAIPVYVVYPRTLQETVRTIRRIGAVAGVPAAGERLARRLRRAVRRLKTARSHRPRPRVLLCVMLHPLVVAGPETLAGDLIRTVGGRNVVPSGPARYPTWGPEAVLAADPDVIIVSPHPGEKNPVGFFSRWPMLRAVRTGHVVAIDPDWVDRPGPRLEWGLNALAAVLSRRAPEQKEAP